MSTQDELGVRVEDRDGVRWIELDRPSSRNGLTIEVNKAMIEAMGDAGGARAVVIHGANGSFCSGLDLKDAMRRGPQTREQNQSRMRDYFHGLIRAVRALKVPTIAAVDGVAAGFGCDLALACDLRVLSDRARFGEIFVKRGLIPDGGGTFVLPRLIGFGNALDLMLSGDIIDAEEAVRLGLSRRLVPAAELVDYVWSFATTLAKGPPLAVEGVKQLVWASVDGDFEDALERELEGQLTCLQSKDFMEGVMAFLQKREPSFRGE